MQMSGDVLRLCVLPSMQHLRRMLLYLPQGLHVFVPMAAVVCFDE